MFCVDSVWHCTMKNQSGNQYGVAFVQRLIYSNIRWTWMRDNVGDYLELRCYIFLGECLNDIWWHVK
jgi:hypothetical protein